MPSFVGRVVEVWPSRSTIANEAQYLSIAGLRRSLLRRWHGILSAYEERDIRTNGDRSAIEFRYGLLQRVRFMINEVLIGPEVHEVYTDASDCGYRFEQGQLYLVNTNRRDGRYRTGACWRTSSVASDDATEDLMALRAWRSSKPLPPRIYGRVSPQEVHTGLRVILGDDQQELVFQVDASGRFSFDNLEKRMYQLQIVDERGTGKRDIDLSRLRCFEAFPWFSDSWHIGGSPLLINSRPLVLPDPPSLVPMPQPR
jgi:hypothetical protein